MFKKTQKGCWQRGTKSSYKDNPLGPFTFTLFSNLLYATKKNNSFEDCKQQGSVLFALTSGLVKSPVEKCKAHLSIHIESAPYEYN